jgi:hypothetical protein
MEPQKTSISTLKEERTVHLLSTSAFYPTRSAHNSPLRSFSFVYTNCCALGLFMPYNRKREEKKNPFFDLSFGNQSTNKKIQFQSKSKSKIGEV